MDIYSKGLAQLKKYSIDANKIIGDFIDKVNNEPRKPEIAHYTNDLGLAGILDSGTLRFTNVFDLNDPSEIEHGFSHAVKTLNHLAINGSSLEIQFAQRFTDLYKDKLKGTANYYVCSFSAECDDLGQWRSYADNGKGYALVFDTAALENYYATHSRSAKNHHNTFDVRYNDSEISLIQNQLVNGAFNLIAFAERNSLTKSQFNSYMKQLSTEVSAHIIHAALFYKHEAYSLDDFLIVGFYYYMYNVHMNSLRFEWEPKKASANLKKHGVSFEEAKSVFYDERARLIDDPEHSEDEERFILLGLSHSLRVILVCHCYRSEGNVIRIISARKATPKESKAY